MKRNILTIVVVLLIFNVYLKAQTSENKNLAVSFFLLTVHEDLASPNSPEVNDYIYNTITQKIIDESGYILFPKDTLRKKVAYNFIKYPMGTGKKAAKSKIADYYLKMDLTLYPTGFAATNSSSVGNGSIGVGKTKTNAILMMKIKAKLYNASGEKVKELADKIYTENKVVITQKEVSLGNNKLSTFEQELLNDSEVKSLIDNTALKIVDMLK